MKRKLIKNLITFTINIHIKIFFPLKLIIILQINLDFIIKIINFNILLHFPLNIHFLLFQVLREAILIFMLFINDYSNFYLFNKYPLVFFKIIFLYLLKSYFFSSHSLANYFRVFINPNIRFGCCKARFYYFA